MAAMNVKTVLFLVIAGALVGTGIYVLATLRSAAARGRAVSRWMASPADYANLMIPAGTRCERAPFIFPVDGVAGYIWGDSFSPAHRHQGVDIFTGTAPGVTPIIAAADGYIMREPYWKAALIQRIPSDPLNPGRQIWLYYTHLADGDPVETILGCANFGRDADTIATMAGAIAGALRGAQQLPVDWVAAVRAANPVDQNALAASLSEVLERRARAAASWSAAVLGRLA